METMGLSILLFGWIGFFISRKLFKPKDQKRFVLIWISLAAISWFCGIDTILIGLFNFKIYLNHALVGFCVGILMGVLLREKIRVKSD